MNFLLDFIIKVNYTRKEIVKMFILYNFNFHYIYCGSLYVFCIFIHLL